MKAHKRPAVVFQPHTYRHMLTGVSQIVSAIRPTLGPFPKYVVNANTFEGLRPDVLDDGGLIARRVIQLGDLDADVGAMYIRQMLWNLREGVGDGTATAAVLFETIFREGLRYIASGGSPVRLRRYLEIGARVIQNALDEMSVQINGKVALTHVAETVCHDLELAAVLGEVFDVIGDFGQLDIHTMYQRGIEREYIDGMHWPGSVLSRHMLGDGAQLQAELENPFVLITDAELETPQQLLPVLNLAYDSGAKSLFIVARSISEAGTAFLLDKRINAHIKVVAAKLATTGSSEKEQAAMQDLAMMTGGQPILTLSGAAIENVERSHFGQARRIWVERNQFGIAGGKGDPRHIQKHLRALQAASQQLDDLDQLDDMRERIGKFMQGSAILRIGGATETEMKHREAMSKRAAAVIRGAIQRGVVPGGGMALLNCRPMIQKRLKKTTDPDERAAWNILLTALETPARTLLANAGHEPSQVLAQLAAAGPDARLNLRNERVVDNGRCEVWDVANTMKHVANTAIHSAALALTVDVVVYHKNPEQAAQP